MPAPRLIEPTSPSGPIRLKRAMQANDGGTRGLNNGQRQGIEEEGRAAPRQAGDRVAGTERCAMGARAGHAGAAQVLGPQLSRRPEHAKPRG